MACTFPQLASIIRCSLNVSREIGSRLSSPKTRLGNICMWLLSSSFLLLLLVLKSLVPQASDDDGNDEENSRAFFP